MSVSTALEVINKHFDEINTECFWHFMAKHRVKEETYKSSKISERIETIRKAHPENTFDMKVHGLTAMHVAVVKENKAAIIFLRSMGAAIDSKDPFGKTPIDYASKDIRALLLSATAPSAGPVPSPISSVPKVSLEALLEPVFKQHRATLKNLPVYNKNTNDFGLKITKLRCVKPHDSPVKKMEEKKPPTLKSKAKPESALAMPEVAAATFFYGAQNLQQFAKELGFTLNFSVCQYHVRDHLFRARDGKIVTFPQSESIPLALDRSMSRALYLRSHPVFLTCHDRFRDAPGGSIGLWENGAVDLEAISGTAPTSRFYFEGGNLYKVTHPLDSKRNKVFIGEFSYMLALNQLRIEKVFDELSEVIEKTAKSIQAKLTAKETAEIAEEMYAQGLLKPDGKNGFMDNSQFGHVILAGRKMLKGDSQENHFLKVAQMAKFISPFTWTEAHIKKAAPLVAKYVTQKEILKEMIGMTFGAQTADVHIIPQVEYHLDCFMRPGPQGSMFLQDFGVCLDVLKQIHTHAEALQLTAQDRKILERYMQTAEQLQKELSPLLSKARAEIEKAGYTVFPTPGVFHDVSPNTLKDSPKCNMNFLNAITGWSDKANSFYYIAAGGQAGDRLGQILMKSFELFVNQYAKTRVCYIGENPDKPGDFQEARNWWNTDFQAGPHCFTFEEETESYLPKIAEMD
jgi:hypothetical protein